MRLEIVDNAPQNQAAHYRAIRRRLQQGAGLRKVTSSVPRTLVSWTFGYVAAGCNVVTFDFRPIRIAQIQAVVGEFYNVDHLDLVSHRRAKNITHPRQIAMYLCRELTPQSYPLIGKMFGGRDHTTVMHAWRKITALLATDERLADEIELLKIKLRP